MRHRTTSSSATKTLKAPAELRTQLEAARLDLRALYRSLDRLRLTQDLPAEPGHLQELDADFAAGFGCWTSRGGGSTSPR